MENRIKDYYQSGWFIVYRRDYNQKRTVIRVNPKKIELSTIIIPKLRVWASNWLGLDIERIQIN